MGKVNLITLNTLPGDGSVGLHRGEKMVMKMNTEDFEPHVIRGAAKFLADIHSSVVYSAYTEGTVQQYVLESGEGESIAEGVH